MSSPIEALEALRLSFRSHHPIEGYAIDNVLGRGGQGLVFSGRRLSTGRRVAVKVLPQHSAELEGSRLSWLAELEHPHLVGLLDRGGEGALGWVIFEFAGDRTFNDLLADPAVDHRSVAECLSGIAAALAFLHGRGITHRDVKPANILIQNHHARLGDFGLLSPAPEVGAPMTLIPEGTPGYAAPEVRGGGDPGPASDVYGLGRALEDGLLAVARLRGLTSPPPLEDLVLRATASEAARRPHAEDFERTLRDFLTLPATPADAAPRPTRAIRFSAGRRAEPAPSRSIRFRSSPPA